MDIISMIMSRNQSGGERLAYEEYVHSFIYFDGDTTDKIVIGATDLGFDAEDWGYVKIADEPIPANNIESLQMVFDDENRTSHSWHYDFNIIEAEPESDVYFVFTKKESTLREIPLLFVVNDSKSDIYGTWGLIQTGELSVFVGYIKGDIKKLIHPIDPKYIPTMDSITLNGADGKQYKVTVDANGQLTTTPS